MNDPKNFRGIAVIPPIARIYSRILGNLIEENIQPEEQAGFRAGRSTTDNILILEPSKSGLKGTEKHILLSSISKKHMIASL